MWRTLPRPNPAPTPPTRRPHTPTSPTAQESTFLVLLDALATVLASSGHRVAVSTLGSYVCPQNSDGHDERRRRLAIDFIVCGAGEREGSQERRLDSQNTTNSASASATNAQTPASHLQHTSPSTPVSVGEGSDPLALIARQSPSHLFSLRPFLPPSSFGTTRGRVPLLEHAHTINAFLAILSSPTLDSSSPQPPHGPLNGTTRATTTGTTPTPEPMSTPTQTPPWQKFLSTFNRLVEYTTAAHARTLLHRSTTPHSKALIAALCAVPAPSRSNAPIKPHAAVPSSRAGSSSASAHACSGGRPSESGTTAGWTYADRTFLARFLYPLITSYLHQHGVNFAHLERAAKRARHAASAPPGGPSEQDLEKEKAEAEMQLMELHALLIFLLRSEGGYIGRLGAFVRALDALPPSPSSKESLALAQRCTQLTSLGILLRDLLSTSLFSTLFSTHIQPHLSRASPRHPPPHPHPHPHAHPHIIVNGTTDTTAAACLLVAHLHTLVAPLEALGTIQRSTANMRTNCTAEARAPWKVGLSTVIQVPLATSPLHLPSESESVPSPITNSEAMDVKVKAPAIPRDAGGATDVNMKVDPAEPIHTKKDGKGKAREENRDGARKRKRGGSLSDPALPRRRRRPVRRPDFFPSPSSSSPVSILTPGVESHVEMTLSASASTVALLPWREVVREAYKCVYRGSVRGRCAGADEGAEEGEVAVKCLEDLVCEFDVFGGGYVVSRGGRRGDTGVVEGVEGGERSGYGEGEGEGGGGGGEMRWCPEVCLASWLVAHENQPPSQSPPSKLPTPTATLVLDGVWDVPGDVVWGLGGRDALQVGGGGVGLGEGLGVGAEGRVEGRVELDRVFLTSSSSSSSCPASSCPASSTSASSPVSPASSSSSTSSASSSSSSPSAPSSTSAFPPSPLSSKPSPSTSPPGARARAERECALPPWLAPRALQGAQTTLVRLVQAEIGAAWDELAGQDGDAEGDAGGEDAEEASSDLDDEVDLDGDSEDEEEMDAEDGDEEGEEEEDCSALDMSDDDVDPDSEMKDAQEGCARC
ncbi:hypothetical protein D9611_008107 [Ephemerocybe angulata]|uniref:Uncharacterized protein n=1 Tax=Ephemerocybe angulata TaxID=980116 RepID=A0A8H5C0X2_9AGAR|nr:hypothetical protein D9611_008107 [Tulosesus angulatus]